MASTSYVWSNRCVFCLFFIPSVSLYLQRCNLIDLVSVAFASNSRPVTSLIYCNQERGNSKHQCVKISEVKCSQLCIGAPSAEKFDLNASSLSLSVSPSCARSFKKRSIKPLHFPMDFLLNI